VKVFGVTVHFVEPGAVDSGPIIFQGAVDLPDATDPRAVLAALRPLEHELLPRAVALLAAGAVRRDPRHPRRVVVDLDLPAGAGGGGPRRGDGPGP